MTREGFAANNRGIAAGGNLEESFLNEIFDHIRANPISLKEDDQAREKGETQVGSDLSSTYVCMYYTMLVFDRLGIIFTSFLYTAAVDIFFFTDVRSDHLDH